MWDIVFFCDEISDHRWVEFLPSVLAAATMVRAISQILDHPLAAMNLQNLLMSLADVSKVPTCRISVDKFVCYWVFISLNVGDAAAVNSCWNFRIWVVLVRLIVNGSNFFSFRRASRSVGNSYWPSPEKIIGGESAGYPPRQALVVSLTWTSVANDRRRRRCRDLCPHLLRQRRCHSRGWKPWAPVAAASRIAGCQL